MSPRNDEYVVDRREDTRLGGGIRADHAWWVSHIRPADAQRTGTVDVRSLATLRGTGTPQPVEHGAGVLTGGREPLAYVSESRAWGPAPRRGRARRLRPGGAGRVTVAVRPRRRLRGRRAARAR